jgi:hypothetical protein
MSYPLGMDININSLLKPSRDAGIRSGDIIVPQSFLLIEPEQALAGLRGLFFRAIVRAECSGRLHDIIVRQGVWRSGQDGEVAGDGRPMRVEGRRFGTWAYSPKGTKLNEGAGVGYRSWLYQNLLVLVVKDGVCLTNEGVRVVTEALRKKG